MHRHPPIRPCLPNFRPAMMPPSPLRRLLLLLALSSPPWSCVPRASFAFVAPPPPPLRVLRPSPSLASARGRRISDDDVASTSAATGVGGLSFDRPLSHPVAPVRRFAETAAPKGRRRTQATSLFAANGAARSTKADDYDGSASAPFDDDTDHDLNSKLDLNVLLIDNYDSYTYNLYQYLATMTIKPPRVVANDAYESWSELMADVFAGSEDSEDADATNGVDCIVISPGPGRPDRIEDVGVCLEAIKDNPDVPILGVCLGHQALGHVYGAQVTLAPCGPAHGLISPVWYRREEENGDDGYDDGGGGDVRSSGADERGTGADEAPVLPQPRCDLFRNIDQNFNVTRYHSLTVDINASDEDEHGSSGGLDIEPIAWCDGGNIECLNGNNTGDGKAREDNSDGDGDNVGSICMALRHKRYPHYGVQFHPESIGTGQEGYTLLKNFCDFAMRYKEWRVEGSKSGRRREEGVEANTDKEERSHDEDNGHIVVDEGMEHVNGLPQHVISGSESPPAPMSKDASVSGSADAALASSESKYRVLIHKIPSNEVFGVPADIPSYAGGDGARVPPVSPETLYQELFEGCPNAFWLDSSTARRAPDNGEYGMGTAATRADDDGCPIQSNSRFSILGGDGGPLCRRIEYYGSEHPVERQGLRVVRSDNIGFGKDKLRRTETVVEELDDMDILTYLQRSISDHDELIQSVHMVKFGDDEVASASASSARLENISEFPPLDPKPSQQQLLPFEYRGGYVGYLGYEVRHDTCLSVIEQEGGSAGKARYCRIPDAANGSGTETASATKTNPLVPTAAFLFADRSLVYDHWAGDWYLVGVAYNEQYDGNENKAGCRESVENVIDWVLKVKEKIKSLSHSTLSMLEGGERSNLKMSQQKRIEGTEQIQRNRLAFTPKRRKAQYEDDIARCHREMRNGESYELCLTNQLETEVSFPSTSRNDPHVQDGSATPFGLYKILRRRNPAPFAAFMKFHGSPSSSGGVNGEANQSRRNDWLPTSVSICCSSPERFLSISRTQFVSSSLELSSLNGDENSNGWEFAPPMISKNQSSAKYTIESKPIKGTAARAMIPERDDKVSRELKSSVKNRAENLMIVDLLRNDLSRVSQIGSVHVPKLMHIESFATVHQMVSTIRSHLDDRQSNVIDVITACFPGGSMTGAPKLRSMELLNQMEQDVSRGPYSGCLGYVSLNGCMDMNIVIRTAIVTPLGGVNKKWKVCIGAGGAITVLSECEDEYSELMLKARAVKAAVQEWADGHVTESAAGELLEPPSSAPLFVNRTCAERPKASFSDRLRRGGVFVSQIKR